MSATAENLAEAAPTEVAGGADALVKLLDTLVPPDKVCIYDIFNKKHEFPTTISARCQIKVLREFDRIKKIDVGEISGIDMSNIINTIISLASNEEVLRSISRCFAVAHPRVLASVKKRADKEKVSYEEGDFCAADLFPLEEMVSAIVPLFLRLAKRGGAAIAKLNP